MGKLVLIFFIFSIAPQSLAGRLLFEKKNMFSVVDYGAVGNGRTDDSKVEMFQFYSLLYIVYLFFSFSWFSSLQFFFFWVGYDTWKWFNFVQFHIGLFEGMDRCVCSHWRHHNPYCASGQDLHFEACGIPRSLQVQLCSLWGKIWDMIFIFIFFFEDIILIDFSLSPPYFLTKKEEEKFTPTPLIPFSKY